MILLASILTLVACSSDQTDPVALRNQHMEAIARADAVGALALYTDDAVVEGAGLCVAAPCVGKAAILKELERRVAVKTRATTTSNHVSGNVLTTRFEVRGEPMQRAGVDRIVLWAVIEFKDGKIGSHRAFMERSDPETARFVEWQQAQ